MQPNTVTYFITQIVPALMIYLKFVFLGSPTYQKGSAILA